MWLLKKMSALNLPLICRLSRVDLTAEFEKVRSKKDDRYHHKD